MRASTRHSGWAIALASLLAVVGCDRRTGPWVAPEDEPPRLERPLRIPGLETPKPQADAPRDAPMLASGEPVRGTVALAPGASAAPGSVLFVIARRDASGAGPPLAVKRMNGAALPLAFELGPADMMVPGQPWSGSLWISARLDADGNAATRDASDPSATLGAPVQPGATGVSLVLGASAQPSAAASSEPIRGVIRLREGTPAPSTSVLFLVARGPAGGPPLAAKRLPPGPFPLAFEIGAADAMMAGVAFEGPILLSARLDSDGDASSKSPDEPHAEASQPVQPGAQGVELELAR